MNQLPRVSVRVKTVKPERESSDWSGAALCERRWGATGVIVDGSNSHGSCYRVRHDDGTAGWYEPRELTLI